MSSFYERHASLLLIIFRCTCYSIIFFISKILSETQFDNHWMAHASIFGLLSVAFELNTNIVKNYKLLYLICIFGMLFFGGALIKQSFKIGKIPEKHNCTKILEK